MRPFKVLILSNSQRAGAEIRTIIHARDHEEAMNQILLVLGLDYSDVNLIKVWLANEEEVN